MMSIQQILIGMVHSQELAAKERDVKDQLQELVRQMYMSGILYSEAVREFKKRFILHVLKANRGNQCKAARELGMHRNTLSRTITELKLQGEINELCLRRGRGGEQRKLERKYEPVGHVPKTLVPRKRPSSQGPTAVSTQHSA